jgi:glucose-6-phosphate 1-dehydrogenase
MDNSDSRATPADARVIFGVTGDLVHKTIFPAPYAMARRGVLSVPIVDVAPPRSGAWRNCANRRRRASGKPARSMTGTRSVTFLNLLRYVSGDYKDPGTFKALKQAPGDARRPAHCLAIPPALFATVIKGCFRPSSHSTHISVQIYSD